jgi:transcriptional regulator with XRE-family HTH domain
MPKRLKNLIQSPDKPIYAKRMTELRLETKRTQTETGKLLGIPQATYSGYEIGRSEPDIATLTRIANLYGVTLDYLAGNSDKRK